MRTNNARQNQHTACDAHRILFALAIIFTLVPVIAQAQTEKPTATTENSVETTQEEALYPLEIIPMTEAAKQQLDAVIPMLGSVAYRSREEASAALKSIGVIGFPLLRDAYVATDDLEVRFRIEGLVEWMFHEHRVYSQKAFLGVQLSAYQPNNYPEDVPVERSEYVLYLSRVIDDTAAYMAGLTQYDIVLEIDGIKPDANNQPDTPDVGISRGLVNDFSRRIASYKPGEIVEITIYRDGGVEVVPVELGILPEHMRKNSNVATIEKAMTESRTIFYDWWNTYFLKNK
ncbi:MAG: hypothetical protein ACPGXK_08350 [Phycisphaerae bacterium]